MSREEAIGVIKFEKACVMRQDTPKCDRNCRKCDLLLPTEDVLQAYEMAIKALEQEPCEDAKKKLIKDCQPPTDDWEHYADRLHELAYKHGYEQAQKDMRGDKE